MIIHPKVRGFICTTAHPAGCTKNVMEQITYVKNNITNSNNIYNIYNNKKNILIIGASTGYGLASRIVAGFLANANTIGVFFERNALPEKTGSAGWYNSAAFEEAAHKAGLYAKSINGDAFSDNIKQQTIDLIKKDWNGKVDLIIYSIASPRRTDPSSNITYNSVLKPIDKPYKDLTIDINTGKISTVEINPATDQEIESTVKVMGGEDLQLWVDCLHEHKVLANNCSVIAYSYIGPTITYPIYRNGTIGRAKEHLEQTIKNIDDFLIKNYNGKAIISVNKALVTQASSAIPVVPLYISLLYKIMKNKNIHEGCIEQIYRLFTDGFNPNLLDSHNRIRIDNLEMRNDVQQEITQLWSTISQENIEHIADLTGYKTEFYKLFGFNFTDVNYNIDYNINIKIPSILEEYV